MGEYLFADTLRPLREDLFVIDTQGRPVALRGSRCLQCGGVAFPARAICSRCGLDATLVPHRMSTQGVVHASTVARVPSALGHVAPYAYGYVDLPADGTRIFAPLSGAEITSFAPGVQVRVVFGEIAAAAMSGMQGYSFTPDVQEAGDG